MSLTWRSDFIAPKMLGVRYGQFGLEFSLILDRHVFKITLGDHLFDRIETSDVERAKGTVQVGLHDFDGDGVEEIVIALLPQVHGQIYVLKYFPPAQTSHFDRKENWQLFGPFKVQLTASVAGGVLTCPYGSQGLYWEWTWVKDKFIQTAD